MKRVFAVLVSLVMLLGCATAETATETAAETHQIEMKTFPFYIWAVENVLEDFPLYFLDGVDDLPFVEINDWVGFMNDFHGPEDSYHLLSFPILCTINSLP